MMMTFRSMTAVLAIAAAVGLGCLASAQDEPAPAGPKAKPAAPAAKAGAAKAKSRAKGKAGNAGAREPRPDAAPVKTELATFGGGCFWCTEAVFERIPGVKAVVSGYAGGSVPNPSYEMVSGGFTGHAEVIMIEYDPEKVPYEKLLKVFWSSHDPTTLNSQGPDFGTQYRSIILYHSEAQKLAARKMFDELTAAGTFRAPIVTELAPFTEFYPAEPYHQDYYRRHKTAPYSVMYIVPKLKKLHINK